MGAILTEFGRVLKRLYRWLPEAWVPRTIGLCRPVVMEAYVRDAGFREVVREYVPNIMPSEVVTAHKPGR